MSQLSDRPWPLVLFVRTLGFLGSAAVATVVIAVVVIVLGSATWLEGKWDTAAVQFGIYDASWFALLMGLLGVNVFSAAVVRFPWRKNQTGFLLVHAGILLLLLGCWLTWQGGIDAQMSLLEGDRSATLLLPDMHFELAIVANRADDEASDADGPRGENVQLFTIPFRPGPFNWQDYRQLSWFPWAWVGRNAGVIFERDGVKLEALDYYSDSRRLAVPRLQLRVAHGISADRRDAQAWEPVALAVRPLGEDLRRSHAVAAVGDWQELAQGEIVLFRLAESEAETNAFLDSRPVGPLGRWGQIVLHAGGKKFNFPLEDLLAGRTAELGSSGLAVELLEFDRKKLQVALSVFRPQAETPGNESQGPVKKRTGILVLHAFAAHLDRQDHNSGVYGSFWFDPAAADVQQGNNNVAGSRFDPAAADDQQGNNNVAGSRFDPAAIDDQQGKEDVASTASGPKSDGVGEGDQSNFRSLPAWLAAERPRLDIIQGHDQKLYYRAWRAPRLGAIGELPLDGRQIRVFHARAFPPLEDNDKSGDKEPERIIPLNVYVESFMPASRPGVEIRPLPFDKHGAKSSRVRVRLSVDGNSREFWLADAAQARAADERRRMVFGKRQTTGGSQATGSETEQAGKQKQDGARGAAVQLVGDTRQLGFAVVLKDFQRRLDPGTSRPAGYSSRIDFLAVDADESGMIRQSDNDSVGKILAKDVVVSLNRPADFTDPGDGRTYRFFQSGFSGPYENVAQQADRKSHGGRISDAVYRSTFSVSSDPGRQLKYAGCLMIVAGIVVMYYMRAYFFRRRVGSRTSKSNGMMIS